MDERRAFLAWLAARYEDTRAGWQDVVRRRWRLQPDEAIDLPSDDDFSEQVVDAVGDGQAGIAIPRGLLAV